MEHSNVFRWAKNKDIRYPDIGKELNEGLRYDEPFEEYLADKSCISSSSLKRILKSPSHYLADLAGYVEEEESDAFRFGRAAHMMILEPDRFKSLYVVEPEFTGFTKDGKMSARSDAAKKKRQEWHEQQSPNALIIKESEMEHLINMAEKLMDHPQASGILRNGRPEVSGRFIHKETGVSCKIRPDYIRLDAGGQFSIADIKTTKDATEGLFSTDAAKFRYILQLAFYHDGVAQIMGHEAEAVAFIAIEKRPPYSVSLYWMEKEDIELGRAWYEHALKTYVRCVKENRWPGPQREGQMLRLPNWAKQEPLPQFFED